MLLLLSIFPYVAIIMVLIVFVVSPLHVFILSLYTSLFCPFTRLYFVPLHVSILSLYTSLFCPFTRLYFVPLHVFILSLYTSLFCPFTRLYFVPLHVFIFSLYTSLFPLHVYFLPHSIVLVVIIYTLSQCYIYLCLGMPLHLHSASYRVVTSHLCSQE